MLASQFLTKLQQLNFTKLSEVKGLGEVLIRNLQDFTNSDRFKKLLQDFEDLENSNQGPTVVPSISASSKLNNNQPVGKLNGEIICLTGSFDESRDAIAEKLSSLGAKITNTVSSATTILLVGDKPGSKLSKAESLGIKIIDNPSLLY